LSTVEFVECPTQYSLLLPLSLLLDKEPDVDMGEDPEDPC
jgi:hypothetical protein